MKRILKMIYNDSSETYYKKISRYMDLNEKRFIITANPETLMTYEKNEDYKKIFDNPCIDVIPDGIGVIYAGRLCKVRMKERITGYDTMINILTLANQKKKSIYLYGAEKHVLNKVKEKIKKDYPKIKVVGAENGFDKNPDVVFKDIINKKPDVCIVALGIPKQELLINKYIDKFKKGIFIGVGGSFDVFSGTKKRAPKAFIKLRLEWLYRIIKEPKRLKRFYSNNIKFIVHILKIRKK